MHTMIGLLRRSKQRQWRDDGRNRPPDLTQGHPSVLPHFSDTKWNENEKTHTDRRYDEAVEALIALAGRSEDGSCHPTHRGPGDGRSRRSAVISVYMWPLGP